MSAKKRIGPRERERSLKRCELGANSSPENQRAKRESIKPSPSRRLGYVLLAHRSRVSHGELA